MKYSKYNVNVNYNGKVLLYNILSQSLIELEKNEYSNFLKILESNNDNINVFYKNGFLIDDNYDELHFISYQHKIVCSNKSKLTMTIAPTMDCNFACPYCFEAHVKGSMDSGVQTKIVDFVKKICEENPVKSVHLTWFGGEPLMEIDVISKLSESLIRFFDHKDIDYSSSIVTNGYLLNRSIIKKLKDLKVNSAQVTIDGTEKTHNNRRYLVNGGKTYKTIIDNCIKARDINDFKINIRVNVDKTNFEEFETLKEYVFSLDQSNLGIYPAKVQYFPNSEEEYKERCFTANDFAEFLSIKDLYDVRNTFNIKYYSCQAQRALSFCIDPKGYLYKCWNDIGDEKKAFSDIDHYLSDNKKINIGNLVSYEGMIPLTDNECLKCKVYPLCMGGCILRRNELHEKDCMELRFHLKQYVINLYKLKKGGKNDECYC